MSCQETQVCGDISGAPTSVQTYNFGACPNYAVAQAPTPECYAKPETYPPTHSPVDHPVSHPTHPPAHPPTDGDDDDDGCGGKGGKGGKGKGGKKGGYGDDDDGYVCHGLNLDSTVDPILQLILNVLCSV